MISRTFFLVFALIHTSIAFAQQRSLNCLKGTWAKNSNSDNNVENCFLIVSEDKMLSFVFSTKDKKLNFPLSESLIGFTNNVLKYSDSLDARTIRMTGQYFISIEQKYIGKSKWVKAGKYQRPNYFDCSESNLSLGGGHLDEFNKVNNLPAVAINALFDRQQRDQQNYLKKYLGKEAVKIKNKKLFIHQEPDGPVIASIEIGQIIFIERRLSEWTKIELIDLRDQIVIGWVRNLKY